MFYKPRVLGLLTGRQVATNWNFWTQPREDGQKWFARVKKLKIDYLVKAKEMNDFVFFSAQDKSQNIDLQPVWENSAYIILKVTQLE